MRHRALIILILVVFTMNCGSSSQKTNPDALSNQLLKDKIQKPRTIVTTDGEVDDMDTFIRMLLYSNEFQLDGLVYSSSQWHYKGDGKGTLFTSEMESTAKRYGERTDLRWPGTSWMQELIDKYASVYENLKKHDAAYPSPDYLKSIIKVGNIDFEGEMEKDTEGSDFIKNILLDDKPGPVYVQIWGGTNTLARALKSIENQYKGTENWQKIYQKVSDKTFIYTVLDQDATYKKYIEPNWPDIRLIYNSAQFWSFAYLWPRVVPESLKPYMEGKWFSENILFNHGALLENYYTWGDGRQIAGDPEHDHGDTAVAAKYQIKKYSFISEGDSPAYFFLLNYGLRSLENPSFGGLGGRFVQSTSNPKRWEDGEEVKDYNPETKKEDTSFPQVRWIDVLQNDFAARADWCVKSYKEANHAPTFKSKHPIDITAKPGETVNLIGEAVDPDGDKLSYHWWQYQEADTYPKSVSITNENSHKATVTIPSDAKPGETIHLILEATDNGLPQLKKFNRVVVTVNK